MGLNSKDMTLQQQKGEKVPRIIATDRKEKKGSYAPPPEAFSWEMKELIKDEGFRLDPYKDSRGFITGGVGHLFTKEDFREWNPDWSIDEKYNYWIKKFKEDYTRASVASVKAMAKWNIKPNPAIEYVIKNMMFNMGYTKVAGGVKKDGTIVEGFKNFFKSLSAGDIEGAILEMKRVNKHSNEPNPWYTQVPERVDKLAEILRS